MSQSTRLTPEQQREEVLDRFRFHPATPVTGPLHDQVRHCFRRTADDVLRLVPPGRHQSLALTALQEAMMWANAGIACDTEPTVPVQSASDSDGHAVYEVDSADQA
jgi:hypothetical protein